MHVKTLEELCVETELKTSGSQNIRFFWWNHRLGQGSMSAITIICRGYLLVGDDKATRCFVEHTVALKHMVFCRCSRKLCLTDN